MPDSKIFLSATPRTPTPKQQCNLRVILIEVAGKSELVG